MELMVFHVDLVIRNEVDLSLPSHLEKSLVDLIRLFHVVAGLLGGDGGVLEARERRALAVHEHFLAVLVILILQIRRRADASQRGVRVVHAAVETVGVLMAAHEVVLHALGTRMLMAEGTFHFLAEHGGVVIGADAAIRCLFVQVARGGGCVRGGVRHARGCLFFDRNIPSNLWGHFVSPYPSPHE